MNRIRDEEIENILFNLNWNDSEDGADLSDLDDIPDSNDYFNHILDNVDDSIDIQNLPLEIIEEDGQVIPIPSTTSIEFQPIELTDNATITSTNLRPRKINKTPTIITTQSTNISPPFETVSENISPIQTNNIVYETEQINVRARPQVLTRPKELLSMKWKKGSFQKSETILYENNKLPNNISSMVDPLEFFIYIGICIYASVLHVPKVRDYWSIELGFSQIYKCMSRTRFEAIRSCLHFNDNSKLLPVTDINHDRLHKLRPLIDYLNNKFKSVPYRQDLSLDEQLCATKAHSYLKHVPVMDYLHSRGILSLGTVRTNRLTNCKLNDSKMQKKLSRKKSIEYISSYKNTPISALTWKDNKPVTLLSTYAGKLPETKVKRFNRSTKSKIEVSCPFVVTEYNRHMGGVDLLDSLIGRYKIKNAFQKVRVKEEQNLPMQFELADWRKNIAYSLTKSGDFKNQRGRRSISIETRRASTRALVMHPTRAVRTDGVGHSQIRADKRGRCKFPKCNGYTWIQCNKCNILLCNSKTKKCFNRYHDE
ncbi:piggyBac transposable element-derived protein 2-like [Aphis craccivora]|uniref:PiggyBac transposable element-derived protein 2-like n=1 Tax=Aphis craccivora TaxID=307492 RepID=A0A6G0YGK8_APHCR|nr:piggyBac transposable element-derived protein 2-like [Aphis craccivora]